MPTLHLGSGCFWGREYHLRQLPGVISTQTGFAGGTTPNPTYHEVCTKATGHAEVVEVVYDDNILSTKALLTEFFLLHDFTIDRRSSGGQYRSVIFMTKEENSSLEQEKIALVMLALLREQGHPPATELGWIEAFYPADARHQQYCKSHGITPKRHQMEEVKEILTF